MDKDIGLTGTPNRVPFCIRLFRSRRKRRTGKTVAEPT